MLPTAPSAIASGVVTTGLPVLGGPVPVTATPASTGLPVPGGPALATSTPTAPSSLVSTPSRVAPPAAPAAMATTDTSDPAIVLLGQKIDQLVEMMNRFTSMMIMQMSAPNATGSRPSLPTSFTHPPPGFTPSYNAGAMAQFAGINPLGSMGTAPLASFQSLGPIEATQPSTAAMGQLPMSLAAANQANNGYDSSDSQYSGVPKRQNAAGNCSRSNGRQGGTSKHVYASSSRSSNLSNCDIGFVSTSDDDPDYEDNRRTMEGKYCRKLNISKYSSIDKNQNLVIWLNQFEEAVKIQLNPHSKKRHWKQCLKWLPLSLSSDAYAIWQRAASRNSNWTALRAELEKTLEDDDETPMWDEIQPLRTYWAKVESYVDTFDKELIQDPEGRKSQCYTRFVNGLPEDYAEYIVLSMPAKCLDVKKALEACLRFQSVKRQKCRSLKLASMLTSATLPGQHELHKTKQVKDTQTNASDSSSND